MRAPLYHDRNYFSSNRSSKRIVSMAKPMFKLLYSFFQKEGKGGVRRSAASKYMILHCSPVKEGDSPTHWTSVK